MKKFFDRVQIWLYLAGFSRLANLIGVLGSPPQLSAGNEDDRITLPEPVNVEDLVPNARSGPGWSLDEFEIGPLKVIDFDVTFNKNPGIDMNRDIALPHTKLDVN